VGNRVAELISLLVYALALLLVQQVGLSVDLLAD